MSGSGLSFNSVDDDQFEAWRQTNTVSVAFFEEVERLLGVCRAQMGRGDAIFKDDAEKTLGHSAEMSGKCLAFEQVLRLRPVSVARSDKNGETAREEGY